MTAKEKLRQVAGAVSEQEAEAALAAIAHHREQDTDPLVAMLDAAPEDDEPTTSEEEAAVRKARAEYRRGEVFDAEQIKREIA
jgi:hypothetical protein